MLTLHTSSHLWLMPTVVQLGFRVYIEDWAKSNNLKLNRSKSEEIIITCRRWKRRASLPVVHYQISTLYSQLRFSESRSHI